MTGHISRGDIEGAIYRVTGNPSSGIIHDFTPAIVDSIDELINGAPVKESRIVKAAETRKADDDDK